MGRLFTQKLEDMHGHLLLLVLSYATVGATASSSILTSSVDEGGLEAVCPGETVTFTCTVTETTFLRWNFFGSEIEFFPDSPINDPKHMTHFVAKLDSVTDNGGLHDLTSTLSVIASENYNGSTVNCSNVLSKDVKIIHIAGIPSPPRSFQIANRVPRCHDTEVTFTWQEPYYTGKTSIEHYTFRVDELGIVEETTLLTLTYTFPASITLYPSISATNCIGESYRVISIIDKVGCPSPPPLPRGSKSSDCTAVGVTVEYQCDPGLLLLGESVVTCTEGGVWSPDPNELSCKVQCSMIDHIENGQVLISDSSAVEGSEVHFTCNSGYILHGPSSSTCSGQGNWYPDHSDVTCKAVCSVPQPPINGVVSSVNGEVLNGGVLQGAVAEYHCDEGLLPEGNFTAKCVNTGNGGEWNPNPADEICRLPAFCSDIVVPPGAYFCQSCDELTLNKTEGDTAVYFCQISDGIWMNKSTTCSSNGTWTPEVECSQQVTDSTAIYTNYTTRLVGAVVSSIVASTLISLLLGGLLMWYIMTKLTQRKQNAQTTSSTERSSPLEASSSSTAPYYTDVRVREEQFKFRINVNAAYAKSGQPN